ncbi:hypothetical protein [Dankookia sp. P2]|uniref:hypothetical protein n=1 Tax=Dankookia sp. P2 TaxID=3423955 RepID=UPI003D666D6B
MTGGLAAANLGSVMVIGRSLPDAAVSAISGRDCSIVRLDQGQAYCRLPEPPPLPPPYCTRSIGRVDCWRAPPLPCRYLSASPMAARSSAPSKRHTGRDAGPGCGEAACRRIGAALQHVFRFAPLRLSGKACRQQKTWGTIR